MTTTDFDLRAKLAQQDAALQAMSQHLEKFKDFELESSVKVTEELAQAMEIQSQLRLRNESLVRTIENQAHTIELLLLKRSQLLGELEETQQHSSHLRSEFDEQLGIRESAYTILNSQLQETKGELDVALMNNNRLETELHSNILKSSEDKLKIEEQLLLYKQDSSYHIESLRSSYETELLNVRVDLDSCKSAHLNEIDSIRKLHESQVMSAENQFQACIAKLEAENENLRSKALEEASKAIRSKYMEDNLSSQLKSCHNTICSLQCQLELAVAKLEERTRLQERISAFGNEQLLRFHSLEMSFEDELAKICDSKISISDSYSTQVGELNGHNERLLQILGKACDRNLELKAETASLHAMIAKFEMSIEEQNEQSNQKEKELLSDCDSHKTTINLLRNQLNCDYDRFSKGNTILEEQLSSVKKDYENRLQSLHSSHEKELAQMKDILEITKVSHVEELSFLQRQCDSRIESVHVGLSKRIAELETENEKLRLKNTLNSTLDPSDSGTTNIKDQVLSENEELNAVINRLKGQLKADHIKFSEEKSSMKERLTILEKESLERFDVVSSYESQLSQMQESAMLSEVSFSEKIAQLQQKYEAHIESFTGQFKKRIAELELEIETLTSKLRQFEQSVSNHRSSEENEQQLVSELETSLLECEQLYIVNSALKAAQNQAVEDARRFQARIKELSAEAESRKSFEDIARVLRFKLETTALKVQKLCCAISTIPAMFETSLQTFELSVSEKIVSFTDRLEKNSAQISSVKQAINFMSSKSKYERQFVKEACKNAFLKQLQITLEMFESSVSMKVSSFNARVHKASDDVLEISNTIQLMQSHFEYDLSEFEKARQGEQAGFQRIVDCSQTTIDELLNSRVQLELHVVNLSRELEDINRKFDHANECLSRELMAQSAIHSLFESLQFQTMHLLSSLQHDVNALTKLSRTRGKQIQDLELYIQKLHIKISELRGSCNLDRIQIIAIKDATPNRCQNRDHVAVINVVKILKKARRLSDIYQSYAASRYYQVFEEISRIVISETEELKARHELVVNSLLKQLANSTDSSDSSYYENHVNVEVLGLTTSFKETLSIIESECYPPGRFSHELKQLFDLFQQANSINSLPRNTASFYEQNNALADSMFIQGRFCEKCTKPSTLPIYCQSCSNVQREIETIEQSNALQQVAKARHELHDEVSQLRSCLNKAAAAITELEIRLQEATIEKARLLDDFERTNKEKQAYVALLQESVNEIHSLEDSERDLRNAHRSVDEELHRSKVLLIGEGRAKQIFSRRVRMLQDTLSLTRAELQQYKLDCARLDTLNKKYLAGLEAVRENLSNQSASPKRLQSQVSQLENDLSSVRLQLAQSQQMLSSYESALKDTQFQNTLLKRTLIELKATVERGLKGFQLLIPQAKVFIVDYVQGEARALSNHCQSLLKLISLDRHAIHHLQARLSEFSEKDLLQAQALARAGRQLKEFQIVLSAQSTQIQSLKHQLRRSESDVHASFPGPAGSSQIAFKRLTSERDLS